MYSGLVNWLGGGVAGTGTGLVSYLVSGGGGGGGDDGRGENNNGVQGRMAGILGSVAAPASTPMAGYAGFAGIGLAGDVGGVLGWELRRILFWFLMLVLVGVVAIMTTPNEASFRAYLTELSFRKHLRDLHGPSDSTNTSNSTTSIASNTSDDLSPRHLSAPNSADEYGALSGNSDVESRAPTGGKSLSRSGTGSSPSPTPFRFSNHVAISLRTPGYRFFTYHLFSIVCILPAAVPASAASSAAFSTASGSASTPASATSAASTSTHRQNRRQATKQQPSSLPVSMSASASGSGLTTSLPARSSSGTGGQFGLDSTSDADPTISGIWFLGAFGNWYSMGALRLGFIFWPPIPFILHMSSIGCWLFTQQLAHTQQSTIQRGRKGASLRKGGVTHESAGLLSVTILQEDTPTVGMETPSLSTPSKVVIDDSADGIKPSLRALYPDRGHNHSPSPLTLPANTTIPLQIHSRPPVPVIRNEDSHHSIPISIPSSPTRKSGHLRLPELASDESATLTPSMPDESAIAASPLLTDLHSSLLSTQSIVQDLRTQITSFESSVAHRQLQTAVDSLRKRKKDEDSERAELKARMKGLEENKRQAEGVKRDAEKKLRSVESVRDGSRSKISNMQSEIDQMREEMDKSKQAIEESGAHREQHALETHAQLEDKKDQLEQTEREINEGTAQHANLTVQVLQAVESLQALIEQSPPVPTQEEDYDFVVKSRPTSHLAQPDSGFQPYPTDPYYRAVNATPPPHSHSQSHVHGHAHASTNTYGADFRPFSPAHQYGGSRSGSYRDLPAYESGFSQLMVPASNNSIDLNQEPGSPNGTMSSSFSVNLLPQGLFSSLEGDVTPIDGQTEMGDDSSDEFAPAEDHRMSPIDDRFVASQSLSLTTSPASNKTPPASQSHLHPSGAVQDPDKLRRILDDLNDAGSNTSPRRWFHPNKSTAHKSADPPAGSSALFSIPIDHRSSSESLLMPQHTGSGLLDNPFAPSAAEKKALKWGTLGKWGIGSKSVAHGSVGDIPRSIFNNEHISGPTYRPYLNTPTHSARSSSVDLTTARSAWDQATVSTEAASVVDDGTSCDRKAVEAPGRVLSLSRKTSGKNASQGSGAGAGAVGQEGSSMMGNGGTVRTVGDNIWGSM